MYINSKAAPIFKSEHFTDPNRTNLVDLVSTKKVQVFNETGKIKIAAFDYGIKFNQIRILCDLGARVDVLPWNDRSFDLNNYDGLFLSNGPGDPAQCTAAIEILQKWLSEESIVKPVSVHRFFKNHIISYQACLNIFSQKIFGICLGHQLLSLAAGFKTSKMKYGNRGQNQPCTLVGTKRCYITCQNHGYAVDTESASSALDNWEPLFYNENDKSNEGVVHKTLPYFSVQFHPEHMAGPRDTMFLFNIFMEAVVAYKAKAEFHLKSEIYKATSTNLSETAKLATCFRPKKVLLLGSGGLSIGQAGEFDYSGSQVMPNFRDD